MYTGRSWRGSSRSGWRRKSAAGAARGSLISAFSRK
ncbi:hypothetical protein SCE1572_38520 [Sorangium cellulosum So0157-2]|uniref:Uncharacterized protein n=1 Tax=Sorangium cellulosum So0157-2 TaxID=1254432 RepID=S4Y611_SORCE|nr:hypothetical protein SCE1572_38520 [Sorangium cellulosum So0157-2]